MAGRPKIFEESAVINQATTIFWQHGYEATPTETLLAAMGIGKGSFYLAFKGGKKELFQKSLEQFNQEGITQLRRQIQESPNPMEEIRQFFRNLATAPADVHMKGCYLGNTIVELANTDPTLMEKAVQLLQQLEKLFEEVIKSSQKNNALKNQESPAVLARYLLTVWNGLQITRRMYPDAQMLAPLIEMQLEIIA